MKRLFIDSSVLFAAAYSEKGYARDIILLGIRERVILIISPLVIEETRRNLASFAPEVLTALERIFSSIPFEIVDPEKEEVVLAAKLVALKDAPILAAALKSNADILVTLDKKHLLDHPDLIQFLGRAILTPKQTYEFLQPLLD